MLTSSLRYLCLFPAGWRGTGPCVEIALCLTGKKNTGQQRMSVKCVVLVLCARNRHDGWLITGCGSDDATPRARLCCLCLMQALIATHNLICAFSHCPFTDITCFVFSLETVSWPSAALIPSGSGRSRLRGAWRKQQDGTTWPVLSLSGCRLNSAVPLAKRAEKIKPVQRKVKMEKLWMNVEWERIWGNKKWQRWEGSK